MAKQRSSKECMELEALYNARNYSPIPVVFSRAKGVKVWDPEGKEYIDCLSAYGAVNQGHCHPRIVNALIEQAQRCPLSSRAFFTDKLGPWAEYMCKYFGYELVLPMNTGAEAVETAIKATRKWGYLSKKIPQNEALIITCEGNFHGRTTTIVSFSTDPDARNDFGPFTPGFITIPYNDADALEKVLEEHGPKVAGFLVEPLQGEAGVMVPTKGYLKKCSELCKKHNVLLIADEIQSGLGRTGKLLCQDHDGVKADVVTIGKALGGGVFPISAVLSSKAVLGLFKPGEHGSTFGGCPAATATAMEALAVLKEEKMSENSLEMGKIFRDKLNEHKFKCVKDVRGLGLMNAVEMVHVEGGKSAYDVCTMLAARGILCKPTHETIIRLTPPLVITKEEILHIAEHVIQILKEIDV